MSFFVFFIFRYMILNTLWDEGNIYITPVKETQMRDDYKKQLKDYRQDYTDDEIRHRLKTIKDIRTEHYDNLERILGIKISNELRDIFNSIIGKTIQEQEYQMEDSVRILDKSYKEVSKKFPQLFKDIPR